MNMIGDTRKRENYTRETAETYRLYKKILEALKN